MNLKFLFTISLCCIVFASLHGQRTKVLECKYSINIFRSTDTTIVLRTVWITDDRIYDFNSVDSSKASLYDFTAGERILVGPFGLHRISIKDPRYKSSIEISENNKDNDKSNLIINSILSLGAENQKTYLDSTIMIPRISTGGYRDYLDNGFGFLPIKCIRRMISDIDGSITMICTLLSKETKVVDIYRIKNIFEPKN